MFFGLAAVSAYAAGVDKDYVSSLSGLFVVSRVLYVPAYVAVRGPRARGRRRA